MHNIDVQGHRGCRGLYPENSIPGFIHALELGVRTLEMDVVISGDGQVVVSHEPWFGHQFCLTPAGDTIHFKDEKKNKIMEMTMEEIRQFDCGTKIHEYFPNQKKVKTAKPTLKEVVDAVNSFLSQHPGDLVTYNIETKSRPAWDSIFTPPPEEFVDILHREIVSLGIVKQTIVQSFDPRTLEIFRTKHADLRISLLISNNSTVEKNLESLSFKPDYYSPNYLFLSEEQVDSLQRMDISVVPWTLNFEKDINKMIEFGVDGIITDYPDLVFDLLDTK